MILRLLFAVVAGIALPLALHAQEILFGASVQLTGSTANTGRYYRDAYEFAIDKINAAGGVKVGNASQKLALKLYDNQSACGQSEKLELHRSSGYSGSRMDGTHFVIHRIRAGSFQTVAQS